MNLLRKFGLFDSKFLKQIRWHTSGKMSTKSETSDTDLINDKTLFSDLPPGPLDRYRHIATFDWRKLTLVLEGEKCLRFRNTIWKYLEENPIFDRSLGESTLDEKRELAVRRQYELLQKQFVTLADKVLNPDIFYTLFMSLIAYEPNCIVKMGLSNAMFPGVLRTMGTERLQKYAEYAENGDIYGAFALTEISHGSNALGMRTTATYDNKSGQFIINTPDFEAAKCWIGNLGKCCTHAIVYAQLYTSDGKHQGLNAFLVPIRDRYSHQSFAGVVVGDLGEKIGLNGLDNGFVLFDNYRIPKEFLLARTGDISEDGKFVSPIKDNKKRIGASFGALSGGRVDICGISTTYLIKAISIAVRYSASRLQFKDEKDTAELPILEYQSQQYRLLPHLATAIVQNVFSKNFAVLYGEFTKNLLIGESVPYVGNEIHALSSAAKPVCTWAVRDAIQDCREATGGHGYLKVAGFGDLRNDNDPNCTYEGENNVLLQQTSNWMLGIRKTGYEHFAETSPLGTAQFLQNFNQIINKKFDWTTPKEALRPNNILTSLSWLLAWLLETTYVRSQELKHGASTPFNVRNDMQVFYAQTLAIVYGQRTIFESSLKHISALEDTPEKKVLERILSLYGGNLLLRHIGSLYEGGYVVGSQPAQLIKQGILENLQVLKNDSVALVDAIAPSDFVLNSPLGMSDGEVYKHLQNVLWQTPGTFERPEWWRNISNWRNELNKSKL